MFSIIPDKDQEDQQESMYLKEKPTLMNKQNCKNCTLHFKHIVKLTFVIFILPHHRSPDTLLSRITSAHVKRKTRIPHQWTQASPP